MLTCVYQHCCWSLRWFKEREKHLFFIAYPVLVFLAITFSLLIKHIENELHLHIELAYRQTAQYICICMHPSFRLKINKNGWRKKGQKKSCAKIHWFKIQLIKCIDHEAALYTNTNTKCFWLASCARLMWGSEQSGLLGFIFWAAFKSQVKT